MIKLLRSVSALALLCIAGSSDAQVSFTNMNNMLQPINGSSSRDCAVDMNGDELDDIVRVVNSGIYVDYQQSNGTMNGVFYPLNIQNMPNWSICAADIDENGFTDLLFGNGSRVSFVMANDNGTAFTEDARPEYIFCQRSTFADINNDGHIDAFVCHDVDQSHPYRNDGNGNLTLDIQWFPTLDEAGNYSAIWVDYDNDGDSDLYITKCSGGAPAGSPRRINLLYSNNGDGTFTEVGEEANLDDDDQSWTTVFEDFNNDGLFDAFIVNHEWANRMMMNNGDGTFTDQIASTGIAANDLGAWNGDGHDFDNNGFIDILAELDREIYLNNGDGTFTGYDLSFSSGGIGDFNNDGFLDVINGSNMWINNANNNNWVKFNLEGLVSNKDAIGTRIEIYGDWGIQVREIRAGESFSPMSSLTAHFGLGTANAIDQVIIKWPSGIITVLDDAAINTAHDLIEAPCIAAPSTITTGGALTICPGDFVTLTAEAGTSYTWSNGQTTQSIQASASGSYNVIVWEDDCASVSNSVIVEVITEEVPSIELQGSDIICQGDEVFLIAGPGSGYLWSNGMTDQMIAVSEGGDYSVTIDGLCQNVELVSDVISITALPAPATPEAVDVQMGAPGIAELSASGQNLLWYDSEDATDAVGEGSIFFTEFVSESATYYVESNIQYGGEEEVGGKATNAGAGSLPSTGAHSFFNAWEPFTIETVRVYVPSNSTAGVRTVQLVDGSGVVLQSATFDLAVGEHVIELNFDVPVGNGMSLRCPEHTLFRNSGGVAYPYAIGTVGEIYDSVYGASFYYYFYDWNVRKQAFYCSSPRVAVNVTVVSVENIEGVESFNVYPNPSNGVLIIELELTQAADIAIRLVDMAGRTIVAEELNQNQLQVRHVLNTDAAAGVYQLVIELNGAQITQKVIID
jgi:hypothetical protein